MEKRNILAPHEGKVLPTVINLRISELILTPLICASLVGEILKGLLYQKNQIPYPYSWMQNMVIKKRQKQEADKPKKENMTVLNYYRTVSSAYDTIEEIVKAFKDEFSKNGEHIKEVVIIFGTMPQSPKEVFSISIPDLAVGHIERNHIAYMSKYQQKILRNIFLSQDWIDSIDSSVSCTNTFIYMKKDSSGSTSYNSDTFIPSRPLTFSQGLKHTKINILSEYHLVTNCCENLIVYGQSKPCISSESTESNISVALSEVWYQFKDMVKGFRDCYVDKVSAICSTALAIANHYKNTDDMIVFLGGPLLDIIANVDVNYLKKYNLKPDETVSALPKHEGIFTDILKLDPIILPGGSVTNSARVMNWICRKQYRVVFAGAIGDDVFGHLIKGKFEDEKIHHHLVEVKEERTGVCAVLLTGKFRTLVSRLGASKYFTKNNLDGHMWGHLERAQFIYISAFFLGVSFEVIKDIFSHFEDHRKTVIVNLAATFLSNAYPKEITYLFKHGDIVFGNENEYKAFLAVHDSKDCHIEDVLPRLNTIFNRKPNRLLVMTRGSKPLYVLHQSKLQEIPVPPIDKEDIIDSNGAGDAFVGGFLAQYVHGKSLEECVRCGTWTAKEVLQHHGCSFDQNKVYEN